MTEREISIVDAWVEKGIEFYVKYRPVFDILPLNLFDEEDLYGVYVQPDDTLFYVHPTVAQWKEKIKLRGRDFFKDVDLTDDVVQWIIGILDVRMGIRICRIFLLKLRALRIDRILGCLCGIYGRLRVCLCILGL